LVLFFPPKNIQTLTHLSPGHPTHLNPSPEGVLRPSSCVTTHLWGWGCVGCGIPVFHLHHSRARATGVGILAIQIWSPGFPLFPPSMEFPSPPKSDVCTSDSKSDNDQSSQKKETTTPSHWTSQSHIGKTEFNNPQIRVFLLLASNGGYRDRDLIHACQPCVPA